MKVILGGLIGEASGKVGGVVFSHGRGGPYVRRRAKPVIVTTQAAMDAKARFSTASAAWSALDSPSREAWTLWSANNPIVDRLGNKITLDGHAAYVRCNTLLSYVGEPLLDLPPTHGAPAGLSALALVVTPTTHAIQVTWTPTPLVEPTRLLIRACIETSLARNYVKGALKLCGITDAAEISPLEIRSMMENRLGTIQVNDYVHVECCFWDVDTGLTGMPLSASIQVTG